MAGKVNLNFEIDRFGLCVRVGGGASRQGVPAHLASLNLSEYFSELPSHSACYFKINALSSVPSFKYEIR